MIAFVASFVVSFVDKACDKDIAWLMGRETSRAETRGRGGERFC
jgi:hypothetical protein